MKKMVIFDKCRGCPHHDFDANTSEPKFWGEHVCCLDWEDGEDEHEGLHIIPDTNTIPAWCKLDDAPGVKGVFCPDCIKVIT